MTLSPMQLKARTTGTPPHEEGFNSKLLAYSATAGAALLLAPAADAQTYNLTLFRENNYNHPGGFTTSPPAPSGANFSFTAATYAQNLEFHGLVFGHHGTNSFGIHFAPNYGDKLGQSGGNGFLDFKFASHAVIAHGAPSFGSRFAGIIALRTTNPTNHNIRNFGNFFPTGANAQKSGYIGFETRQHGDYGWLKIQVTNDGGGKPSTISFVVASDGLYGQIGDSSTITNGSAIPEPANVASGLGLLALGAAGVREMRRRRTVAA